MLLLMIIGIAIIAGLTTAYVTNAPVREVKAKERVAEANGREAIATNAMLAIRNGSGSPELEAQIALDQITNTYTKEIQ